MKPTFLTYEMPLLTAMIQCETPEACKEKIARSLAEGAEALGVQLCTLLPEYRTPEQLREIFAACCGKPIYVTSYRGRHSKGLTDEECTDLLLMALHCGATLCDVMGDLYCPDPIGLTMEPAAVERQKKLIGEIHRLGGEVLMSVHTKCSISREKAMEIALAEESRGVDVIKIVADARTPEEIPAYVEFIQSFTKTSRKKLLFLASGAAELTRYIGPSFGVCMYLCVQEHGPLDTKAQPLLRKIKAVRENLLWE